MSTITYLPESVWYELNSLWENAQPQLGTEQNGETGSKPLIKSQQKKARKNSRKEASNTSGGTTGNNSVGLALMPPEIKREIASYLTRGERLRLAKTCRLTARAIIPMLYEADWIPAFWFACTHNNQKLLAVMLKHDGSLANRQFTESFTLKEKNLARRRYTGMRAYNGRDMMPLATAMQCGAFNSFLVLLHFGANVNVHDTRPLQGHNRQWYPINWAVHALQGGNDFEDCVKHLIARGADPNQRPFIHPLQSVDPPFRYLGDFVPLFGLLELRPLVNNPRGTFQDCLNSHAYFLGDRLKKIKTLLRLGANPNLEGSPDNKTPIFRMVEILCEFGPDHSFWKNRFSMTQQDKHLFYEETIIPHAVEVIKALLKHGANPNFSYGGNTPLHLACSRYDFFYPVADALLDAGANINAVNYDSRTPIYKMIHNVTNVPLIEYFIQQGANARHLHFPGHELLRFAVINSPRTDCKLTKVAMILVRRGADVFRKDHVNVSIMDILRDQRPMVAEDIYNAIKEHKRKKAKRAEQLKKAEEAKKVEEAKKMEEAKKEKDNKDAKPVPTSKQLEKWPKSYDTGF
ncbi:hypothetical protein M426DRAFT_24194 [Hypoxylon sp. CI-4A]|nr:hypothetical protein M426DRAFT_24194 [Hypoxylon sp. CI-4A]